MPYEVVAIALNIVAIVVFFSVQIQKAILTTLNKIGQTIGVKTQGLEYGLQRYVFSNSESLIAKAYYWVNDQIICLGLKKQGVTAVGFISFWGILAVPLSAVLVIVLEANILTTFFIYVVVLLALLFITRMRTASSIEARESVIMDTIDLLVPEIDSGVKNVIMKYQDVISETLRIDFSSFLDRIEYKGYTFEDSITILADDIGGNVFRDFAQKAIFYERQGDKDMIEVFSDIVETNRLRRELREQNRIVFDALKQDFIMASAIVWIYVFTVGLSESFTRTFMLENDAGKILWVIDFAIEVIVLGFITSIRSKEI